MIWTLECAWAEDYWECDPFRIFSGLINRTSCKWENCAIDPPFHFLSFACENYMYMYVCFWHFNIQSIGHLWMLIDLQITILCNSYKLQFCNFVWVDGCKNFWKLWKCQCTVGPRLSGHQLSGYLHYPAVILQYIVYCLYCLFSTVLLKKKQR